MENEPTTKPRYFRLVEKGEILRKGDYLPSLRQELASGSFGQPLSQNDNSVVLRPVQVDEWISYAEREPRQEDYQPIGKIDGMNEFGNVFTWSLDEKLYGSKITHWRRITPPTPAKPKSVEVTLTGCHHGRVQPITIKADGSIKLECGDEFSAESINQFIKAREELMKQT